MEPILHIHYENLSNRTLAHSAKTYGVPLPQGVLKDADVSNLALETRDGKRLPVDARALERHFDGSIRWLLLDFAMPAQPNEQGGLTLIRGKADVPAPIQVKDTPERITVVTPHMTASISKKKFSLFESYQSNGKEMIAPGSDIIVETPLGKRHYASFAAKLDVRVLEANRQRVVIESSGRHTAGDDSEMLTFRVRYTFLVNEPGVKVSYKFTNVEKPERGVELASIRVKLPTALGERAAALIRQSNHGRHWFTRQIEVKENIDLLAAGAVNPEAKARYSSAADGKIVIRNLDNLRENLGDYPYFLRPGNARADITGGLRGMYPYLGVRSERGSALAFFYRMGENFPKGVSHDRGVITLDIWPAWASTLQVRRGQSKEHDIYFAATDKKLDPLALEGMYLDHELIGVGAWGFSSDAIELTLDPADVRKAEVLELHRWLPYEEQRYRVVEEKMGSLGKGKASAPQMGMFDYGDTISGDRSWAHNNENDAILHLIQGYYRKQEHNQLLGAVAKAKHNAHVDFIAYDPDPLRQGTMPAHCPEHTDGATYPSHMWVGGLLAAYTLTGDPDFHETAISVGENMIRWQNDDPTVFYADSRECGWPMLAWVQLYDHTHDPRWLKAGRKVFEYYRDKVDEDFTIQYELPHGMGTYRSGYGEFIGWRACYFYFERTQEKDVREFLIQALNKVYQMTVSRLNAGGWACNDLFPAWAAYALTGDERYLKDNYEFCRLLFTRQERIPWGGMDVMHFFGELHRKGALEGLQSR